MNMNREERIYSVTMTEDELRLFSEFLNEVELKEITFARKDYEGLTEEGKRILRERRDAYAKQLHKNYRDTMSDIDKVSNNTITRLQTNGTIRGGGIGTIYEVDTLKGTADSTENFINAHKNAVRSELGKRARGAGDMMRGEVFANHKEISKAKSVAPEVKNSIAKTAEKAENIMNKNANPVLRDGKVTKLRKLAKAKKIGKTAAFIAVPTAVAVGTGTAIYKRNKKK